MFVVTNREMRDIDRYTIEQIGIPSMSLMENAGKSAADWIFNHCQSNTHVGVICGKGNNGGDGFVIARHLYNRAVSVSVYITDAPDNFSKDALLQYEIIKNMQMNIHSLEHEGAIDSFSTLHVIVDAMLGTGVDKQLRPKYQRLVKGVNDAKRSKQETLIISIDSPSGIYGDCGCVSEETVCADITLTLGHIKRSLITHPACQYVGELILLDIGIPKQAQSVIDRDTFLLTEQSIKQWLPNRTNYSHKGTYGEVHCIVGSLQYSGAGLLAATACLHIGAGLTYWHAPDTLLANCNRQIPEIISIGHPSIDGHFSLESLPTLLKHLEDADAAVIGCGITRFAQGSEWLMEILGNVQCPIVLDADGFVLLRSKLDDLQKIQRNIVVTPHPGEMAHVLGVSVPDVETNRIEIARIFAETYQVTVVLKGNRTVIATPAGNVYVNYTGSHVLAKAGTGDVLAGFIGGLLAQGLSPETASCVAVYCHGKAAEQLTEKTYVSTMASDVSRNIGAVLRKIANRA